MSFLKFSKFLGVISSFFFLCQTLALCMDRINMCSNCSYKKGIMYACDTNFLFEPTFVCSTECGVLYGSRYTRVPLKGRDTIVYTIDYVEKNLELINNLLKFYLKSRELKSKFAELLKGNKIKIDDTLKSDYEQLQDEAKVNLLFDAALNYYHNQQGRNIIIDLIELGYINWLNNIFNDCNRFVLESNKIQVVNYNGDVRLRYDGTQKIPGSLHADFEEVNVGAVDEVLGKNDGFIAIEKKIVF